MNTPHLYNGDGVLTALRDGKVAMTREQISEAWGLLRARSDRLARQATDVFNVGDTVSFLDKRKKKLTGKVTKINQKTITVRVMTKQLFGNTATGQPPGEYPVDWKVTATLLTKES